nr:putative nuclear envelope pore membrane protein POM 121B [Manis javanica]
MIHVSSFFAAKISGFGAVIQTTSCGTSTSGFGSTISAPFTSRVSAGPTGSGGFGTSVDAPHSRSTTGAFGFDSGRSGRTGLKNSFWGDLNPNSLGAAGQSTPSAFHVASRPQKPPGFAAITSGLGAVTQTTSCGTSTSVFGSPFPSQHPSHPGCQQVPLAMVALGQAWLPPRASPPLEHLDLALDGGGELISRTLSVED